MFRPRSLCAFLACSLPLIGADYTARPLAPRPASATGTKLFEIVSPEDSGVTVPNVFNEPRMWGDRFRELTLGAVETGIAIADFNRDGRPDLYAVSKNGANALYLQVAPFKFMN
ncbi:MAG TPA: VCBS repeat-containing protein, partial [Opitutus sp.]|nr:VCBS repeat-containing protein [Opitutus sp.]